MAGSSTEITADRTATSTTYANPDGSDTQVESAVPVHYQDSAGAWQNIDTTIHASASQPGVLVSGANSFTASFSPLGSGGGVSIQTPSGPVSFNPTGAGAVSPAISPSDPSTVIYANAWPDVDLTYTVTSYGVEEHLLLQSAAAASSFSFATPVSFGAGVATGAGARLGGLVSSLVGQLTPAGRAASSGELVAPVVRLADGAPQDAANPVLASTGPSLSVSLSPSWLSSLPASDFPVDVDPTWVGGASSICFESTGTQQSPCQMQTGNSLAGGNTFWRSIPIYNYSSLDGAHVLAATLAFSNQSAGTSSAEQINVYTATGQSYSSLGAYQGSFTTSGGAGSLSNSTLANTYNSYTSSSYNGVGLMVTGNESAGVYSYQQFQSFTLSLTYDYAPNAISGYSPATGYANPNPPELSAVTTKTGGGGIYYQFAIWTGNNGTGTNVANDSVPEQSGTVAVYQPPAADFTFGQTYYWQVTPNDGYYSGGPSPWSSFTIANPPSAPTGVTATPGDTTATVSWTASTANGTPVTSYTVTSSGGQSATTANGTTTSATVTGLTDGTSYTFTVVANSAAGPSPASTASTAVTPQQLLPSAPGPAQAFAGNGQAEVFWTAPSTAGSSAVYKYQIDIVPSSGNAPPMQDVYCNYQSASPPVGTPSSYPWPCANQIVTGLTNGVTYTFSVRAVNTAGPSAWSTTGSAEPVANPPAYPPTSGNVAPGNGNANVVWDSPAANGGTASTGTYIWAINMTTNTWQYLDGPFAPNSNPVNNSYTVPNLTNGDTYEFDLCSTNGTNTYGCMMTGTTVPNANPGPYQPVTPTVMADNQGTLVTWSAPSTGPAVSAYLVQQYDIEGNGAVSYDQCVQTPGSSPAYCSPTSTGAQAAMTYNPNKQLWEASFNGLANATNTPGGVQGYVYVVYAVANGQASAIVPVPAATPTGAPNTTMPPDYVATPTSASATTGGGSGGTGPASCNPSTNPLCGVLAPYNLYAQGGDQSILIQFSQPVTGLDGALDSYTVNIYNATNATSATNAKVGTKNVAQVTLTTQGNCQLGSASDPPTITAYNNATVGCITLSDAADGLNLVNGTSYYVTVTATLAGSIAGQTTDILGGVSGKSNTITPAGRPYPPTILSVTNGCDAQGGEALVTVQYPTVPANTAPALTPGDNGAAINDYIVTATPASGSPGAGTNITATINVPNNNAAPCATSNTPPPQCTAGATTTQADASDTPGAQCTILVGAPTSATGPDGNGSGTLFDGTAYTFTAQAQNTLESTPQPGATPGPVTGTSDPSGNSSVSPAVQPFVPYGVPFQPGVPTVTNPSLSSALISWTAPAGLPNGVPGYNGAAIDSYNLVITSSTNSVTYSVGSNSLSLNYNGNCYTNMSQLCPGSYTVSLTAHNVAGYSSPPVVSASFTIAGPPSAPTDPLVSVTGSGSTAEATVTWGPANSNGNPIQYYTVTQEPGGQTSTVCPSGSTTCPPGPLTATFNSPYPTTFSYYITATNAVGTGPAAVAVDHPAGPGQGGGGNGTGTTATTPAGGAVPLVNFNGVPNYDAPDPSALELDSSGDEQIYATGTMNNQTDILTESWAAGFSNTGPASEALPAGQLASQGLATQREYAPAVSLFGSNYVMWFSGTNLNGTANCLDSAVSTSPSSNFMLTGFKFCDPNLQFGVFDPSIVISGGIPYILYSEQTSGASVISVAQLSANGTSITSSDETIIAYLSNVQSALPSTHVGMNSTNGGSGAAGIERPELENPQVDPDAIGTAPDGHSLTFDLYASFGAYNGNNSASGDNGDGGDGTYHTVEIACETVTGPCYDKSAVLIDSELLANDQTDPMNPGGFALAYSPSGEYGLFAAPQTPGTGPTSWEPRTLQFEPMTRTTNFYGSLNSTPTQVDGGPPPGS